MGEMTSKEIVSRAIRGLPTPRVASGPLAVHFCAHRKGISLKEYTSSAEKMADSILHYYDEFQPDAVWLSADTWVTAGSMGARVGFVDERQPMGSIGGPLIRSEEDLDRIPDPDPHHRGRFPLMLEAFRRIRQSLGDEVFLVPCFDQYPFSLACALMGAERVMLAVGDPKQLDLVRRVMDKALDFAAAYALALAEEGADLLSGGDSPAGLLGPDHYQAIAFPWQCRLIERIKEHCDLPVSLHVCGKATPYLPLMKATGADVLELDHYVDLDEALEITAGETAVWGNLDPVGLLAQSGPEQVREAATRAIEQVRRSGHRRFVLSSGCTLALETPPENLHAMLQVARQSRGLG